jgi:hypothetical protein
VATEDSDAMSCTSILATGADDKAAKLATPDEPAIVSILLLIDLTSFELFFWGEGLYAPPLSLNQNVSKTTLIVEELKTATG